MKKLFFPAILLMALFFAISGCNKEDDPPAEIEVNFIFKHMVGNEEVTFDDIKYVNAFGNTYSVETLQYFISDLILFQQDGGQIIFDVAHYVDARDASTLGLGAFVPNTTYNKLSFVFGLDENRNVPGAFPNPPQNNMEWPPALGSGYHYMKLEGKFDSTGTTKNYQAHTGPTMGNQNYITVTLDEGSFACNDCEKVVVNIEMDINRWWTDPHTLDLNTVTMVMGNQAMQEKLKANGSNVFSISVEQQ